jgi:hypothetical protein
VAILWSSYCVAQSASSRFVTEFVKFGVSGVAHRPANDAATASLAGRLVGKPVQAGRAGSKVDHGRTLAGLVPPWRTVSSPFAASITMGSLTCTTRKPAASAVRMSD